MNSNQVQDDSITCFIVHSILLVVLKRKRKAEGWCIVVETGVEINIREPICVGLLSHGLKSHPFSHSKMWLVKNEILLGSIPDLCQRCFHKTHYRYSRCNTQGSGLLQAHDWDPTTSNIQTTHNLFKIHSNNNTTYIIVRWNPLKNGPWSTTNVPILIMETTQNSWKPQK